MAFKVMPELCKTCIFSNRSPISPERFEELRATWEDSGVVQECHHATMVDEQIGCRGHYEAARRGEIPHPMTKIAEDMGLSAIPLPDFMQIAERLGWVKFVSEEGGDGVSV